MDTQIFQRFADLTQNMQGPMQELIELNLKTMQSFTYIRPDELVKIKAPTELLEKHMQVTVENGHKALDYMKESFQILEDSLLKFGRSPSAEAARSEFKKVMESSFTQPIARKKHVKSKKVVKNSLAKAMKASPKTVLSKDKIKKIQAAAKSRLAKPSSAKVVKSKLAKKTAKKVAKK